MWDTHCPERSKVNHGGEYHTLKHNRWTLRLTKSGGENTLHISEPGARLPGKGSVREDGEQKGCAVPAYLLELPLRNGNLVL